MRLLIVDDHPTNLNLLRAQLEGEGHVVFDAADGVEALDVLRRQPVDVVISDILMPRLDGYRLCHEVRKSEGLCEIPFIFYTSAYTSPADEKLALEVGANKYLKKPASAATLSAALQEVIAQPRTAPRPEALPGHEVLKEYSERLVSKLEEKITELTVQTETLLRTQEKLHVQGVALESAANAILITDRAGAIQWVNRAFTTLTGYAGEEVIGKTPRVLKSGKHDQSFYRELWKTILTGQTWRGEFVNRRKDGSLFHDEHTITPVRSAGGEISHFIGILHDVTVRKQAAEELRLTHEKLWHLLAHNPAVIYTLKLHGEKITPTIVSDNIERILGVTAAESARNEWWLESLHPEDRDRVVAAVGEGMKGHGFSTEYRIRHKDGTYRWVEDNNRVVRDADGRPKEAVGVWTDISERKRSEEAFKQRAAELERFHRLSVGRELQMIELKKEVNELARAAGKPAPHDLSFLESQPESRPQS